MKIFKNMFEVMNFNKIAEIVSVLRYKVRRKYNLACDVYKTKDSYIIVGSPEATAGFLLSLLDNPIILSRNADTNELQNAVFKSLGKSAKIVPTPKRDDYPRLQKEHLKRMKEKSYASLYRKSSACHLRYENGVMIIAPEKYYNSKRPSDGLVWVEEDVVKISNAMERKEEVISTLIDLLARDYK